MNVTNMKMEKLRVLFEKIGRLASRDTQSMSIYKGCFPAAHHLQVVAQRELLLSVILNVMI